MQPNLAMRPVGWPWGLHQVQWPMFGLGLTSTLTPYWKSQCPMTENKEWKLRINKTKPIDDGAKKLTQQSAFTSIGLKAQIADGNAIKTLEKCSQWASKFPVREPRQKEDTEVHGFTEVKKLKYFGRNILFCFKIRLVAIIPRHNSQ